MANLTPQQAREKWELTKEAAERAHERSDQLIVQLTKAVIKNAETVIRTLILINGAAAISIMTFVGALAAKPSVPTDQVSAIALGLEWFAGGALAATVIACFAYLANSFYAWAEQTVGRDYQHLFLHHNRASKTLFRWGRAWHALALAATIASLAGFAGGIWFVSGGVKAISASTPASISAAPSK